MSKKEVLSKALVFSGVNYVYSKLFSNGITVLMYHGVVKDDEDTANGNWLQVRESEFRKQMEHIKKYYEVVPLHLPLKRSNKKKPLVAITFDDGYANNYNVAYPILKELGIPATIFLVTNLIDSDHIMWYDRLWLSLQDNVIGDIETSFFWLKVKPKELDEIINSFKVYEPSTIDDRVNNYLFNNFGITYTASKKDLETYGYLSMENIKEMDDSGLISFGSHTHNHEIVTKLTDYQFSLTLVQSIEFLKEKKIKNISPIFCFPNGWYEHRHVDILQKGFPEIKGAVTTEARVWSKKDNNYEIPRTGIGRNTNIMLFNVLVSGTLKKLMCIRNKLKTI